MSMETFNPRDWLQKQEQAAKAKALARAQRKQKTIDLNFPGRGGDPQREHGVAVPLTVNADSTKGAKIMSPGVGPGRPWSRFLAGARIMGRRTYQGGRTMN